MRVVMLVLLCGLCWGRDVSEVLQIMHFDAQKQALLRGAMGDFYTEKRVYAQNHQRIRNQILNALQDGKTDFTQHVEVLYAIHVQYLKAEIAFYQAVVGILGYEQTQAFIERLNS